jgi:hypothetical protein
MAWGGTYSYRVLIGLDRLGAALLFNRNDITISTLCGLVQLADSARPDRKAAFRLVLSFGLHPVQLWLLRQLGYVLDKIQTNHCLLAIQGDVETSQSIVAMLKAFDQGTKP